MRILVISDEESPALWDYFDRRRFLISKVYLGNRMVPEERGKIIDICHSKNIPYIGVKRSPSVFEMQDCEIRCEDCPQYVNSKK